MSFGFFKVAVLGILCLVGIPVVGISIKEKFFSSKISVPDNLSDISTKLEARPMATRSSKTAAKKVESQSQT